MYTLCKSKQFLVIPILLMNSVLLIFCGLFLAHDLYSMILNDTDVTNQTEKLFLEKVLNILGPVQSVCYWVKPEFHFTFSLVFNQNKSAFIQTKLSPSSKDCNGFVFFGFPSSSICDFFLKFKLFYLTIDHFVIVGYETILDLEPLASCSVVFDFAQVCVLSPQENVTYTLSLPFVLPRCFNPLSILNSSQKPNDPVKSSIKVATFHCYPFSIVESLRNERVQLSGVEMELLRGVSQYLNLSWELTELQEPQHWGKSLDNGSWVGGIGQALWEGTADVAFCNIWQRHSSLAIMDFSPVLNKISLTFLVHRPYQIHDRWVSLTGIFGPRVWLGTVLGIFIVGFSHRWGCRLSDGSKNTSLTESTLMALGILTISSSYMGPPSTQPRCVKAIVVSWFFFSLLLTTALTSLIVTRLTLPRYSPRIDTVQQLVEGNFYWTEPYYSDSRETMRDFFFNMNISWQNSFEAKYKYIDPEQIEKHMKLDNKLVIPAQQWGDDYVIVNLKAVNLNVNVSELRVMRTTTRETFTSLAFRKGSPFNEKFSRAIQLFVELGLWAAMRKNLSRQEGERKKLLVENDISVFIQPEQFTIVKLYPAFCLLIVGSILSMVVFIIEGCVCKFLCCNNVIKE